MNKKSFDEKQLLDRGKAFQYGFISALITIIAVYFTSDVLEIGISSYSAFLVTLWFPTAVCMVASIHKNAYEGFRCTIGKITCSIMGLGGLFIIIMTFIHVKSGKEALFLEGVLTDAVGHLFSGGCLLIIGITYWIQKYRNSREFADE